MLHSARGFAPNENAPGGLLAERYFRAVHPKYARVAAGGGQRGRHGVARKEAEFHQPPRIVLREIQALKDCVLTRAKLSQVEQNGGGIQPAGLFSRAAVETQLQH